MPQAVGRNGAMISRPRPKNGGSIPSHGVPIGPGQRMAPMPAHRAAPARNVLGRARNGGVMGEAMMSAEVHTGRIHAPSKAIRLRARTATHEARAPLSAGMPMRPERARNQSAITHGRGKTGKPAQLRARRSAPSASGPTAGSIQNHAPTRCAGQIAPHLT